MLPSKRVGPNEHVGTKYGALMIRTVIYFQIMACWMEKKSMTNKRAARLFRRPEYTFVRATYL